MTHDKSGDKKPKRSTQEIASQEPGSQPASHGKTREPQPTQPVEPQEKETMKDKRDSYSGGRSGND